MSLLAPDAQFNTSNQSWQASLAIDLQGGPTDNPEIGTRIVGVTHKGPLYIQKPFYPEGRQHAHLYVLHPPGGLVSGDDLTIAINANKGAGALITTPGAAKVYRARSDNCLQLQQVKLTVKERSCLEWFPQESIIYNGANTEMDTQVSLSTDGSYIGWEILCLGLPNANAPFEKGSVNLRLQVFEMDTVGSNKLIYRDNLETQAGDSLLSSVCGFNQCCVSAYLIAKFPTEKVALMRDVVESMRKCLTTLGAEQIIAVTMMGSLCISRYLGASTAQAKQLFIELWKILRLGVIDREVTLPRIWYT